MRFRIVRNSSRRFRHGQRGVGRLTLGELDAALDLALPDVPTGVPPTFQEHLKLLMDLQVIALQADITRVSTLMFARELSTAVFPETAIRDPFHNLSHHSNDRSNMDRFAQLNTYHVTKLAYLLDRLKKTPDGDGTLLDKLGIPTERFGDSGAGVNYLSML